MRGIKKLSVILVSALLFAGMLPVDMAHAAADEYDLWIGGAQVTSENTSGDGWHYDAETKTLTLNSYSYEGSGSAITVGSGFTTALNIVLKGDNTMKSTGSNVYPISARNAAITISGEGSLDSEASNADSSIFAYDLTINSGKVNATGVWCRNSLTLNDGELTSIGDIACYRGSYTEKLVVNGGVLSVTAVKTSGNLSAIYAGGTATFNGGDISVYAKGENEVNGVCCGTQTESIIIGEGVKSMTVRAQATSQNYGKAKSFREKVYNGIKGTAWTNPEGTTGKTSVPVNTAGQDLSGYKKVQFPAIYTMTVYGSSIDEDKWTDPEPLVIEGIKDGTTIADALKSAVSSGDLFTKDGYKAYGNVMEKPMSAYDNIFALALYDMSNEKVTGDIEVYYPMAKVVNEVSVGITAPAAGSNTDTPKKEDDDSQWDWDSQTNKPEITEDSVEYDLIVMKAWIKDPEERPHEPYIGAFEAGGTYCANTLLSITYGYRLADDCEFKVDGGNFVKYINSGYSYGGLLYLNAKVDDADDPAAANTVKPVLAAKGIANGRKAVNIKWNKVSGADRYVVYMARCNYGTKTYKYKKIKAVSGKTLKITKKKLKRNTAYKFYVVAQKKVNGKYKTVAKSLVGHVMTGNVRGSLTNPKKLTLNKTSLTLATGKSATIKGTVTKVKKNKNLATTHTKLLRYKSDNPTVATVNASGKVIAKSPGTATIYVQTINGMWKTCKVTVK